MTVEATTEQGEHASVLRDVIDIMLENMPSEAAASSYPFSDESADGGDSSVVHTLQGGDVTYSQDELDAAVSAATADLQAKLDELLASQEVAEFDARMTEITEAHAAEVAEFQAKLDEAVAEATAAKTAHEELVSYLQSEQERVAAEAAFDARVEEVRAAVADLFSEEHIEANVARWAEMASEDFDALLEDWKAVATATIQPSTDEPVVSSAMQHTAPAATATSDELAESRRIVARNASAVRSVGGSYK